jgi:hypothetical protein
MLQSHPFLPSHKAFVVLFRAQPADAPLSWEGRIEHLTSDQVLRFHTPEALLACMARVLTAGQESPGVERASRV